MKITLLIGPTFDFSKEFDFDVKVVRSAVAKRLTLRIDEKTRTPVLTIPRFCGRKQALNFLKCNSDWIVNMLAKLPKSSVFSNGDKISFWGNNYIILHNEGQRGTFFEDSFLKVGGDKQFLHRRVGDFLKQQALKKMSEITISKAKILGCKVCSVTMKDTKSRWGSCSTLGNINYNWRVAMAPLFVIEYLICHEVCHLKHPNHSADFWQTLEKLCPEYKEGKHWLKIRGKELYKYI